MPQSPLPRMFVVSGAPEGASTTLPMFGSTFNQDPCPHLIIGLPWAMGRNIGNSNCYQQSNTSEGPSPAGCEAPALVDIRILVHIVVASGGAISSAGRGLIEPLKVRVRGLPIADSGRRGI